MLRISNNAADTVDGAEKCLEMDHDSSVCLQTATWEPAKQRQSDSRLKPTDLSEDRRVTQLHDDDAGCSGSVSSTTTSKSTDAVKTVQISNDLHRLSSVSKDRLLCGAKTARVSSDLRVDGSGERNADETQPDRDNVGSTHRHGQPTFSDLGSVLSAGIYSESAGGTLNQPRRSSAGMKRKSSASKCVCIRTGSILPFPISIFLTQNIGNIVVFSCIWCN